MRSETSGEVGQIMNGWHKWMLLTITGALLHSGASSVGAQSCTSPCRPGTYEHVAPGGTVSFDIDSAFGGSPSDRADFASALQEWNNALQNVNSAVEVQPSSGDVHITFDSTLVGTSTWAISDYALRTMKINPDVFSTPHAIWGLALHEVGHFFGLWRCSPEPGWKSVRGYVYSDD
jgi:hypothetical protein